jgi:hypothetical protein
MHYGTFTEHGILMQFLSLLTRHPCCSNKIVLYERLCGIKVDALLVIVNFINFVGKITHS